MTILMPPFFAAVTGITPNSGGVAGGSRIIIKGSGFSTNQNPVGNAVTINGKVCETVPLHSTPNQIVCKTPPNVEGTGIVKVLVDGVFEAKCAHPYYCQFFYRNCEYFVIHVLPYRCLTVKQ